MKVHVMQDVGNISDRYHADGGVVVFSDRDRKKVLTEFLAPEGLVPHFDSTTITSHTSGAKAERVFIFEDAGCC